MALTWFSRKLPLSSYGSVINSGAFLPKRVAVVISHFIMRMKSSAVFIVPRDTNYLREWRWIGGGGGIKIILNSTVGKDKIKFIFSDKFKKWSFITSWGRKYKDLSILPIVVEIGYYLVLFALIALVLSAVHDICSLTSNFPNSLFSICICLTIVSSWEPLKS